MLKIPLNKAYSDKIIIHLSSTYHPLNLHLSSTYRPLNLHLSSITSPSLLRPLHLLPLPSASLMTCLRNFILIFPSKFSREFCRYPRTKQPLPRTFPRNSLENLSTFINFSSCKSCLSCALAPASVAFLMITWWTERRNSPDGA